MKLLIDVEFVLKSVEEDEEILTTIRSRMYPILNEDELNKAVNNAGNDIQITLENKQLEKSG